MLYIKKNKDGDIVALSHTNQRGFKAAQDDSPEVVDYLLTLQSKEAQEILRSDLDFIRVIEDVIDLLIKKHIVTITDFHPAVIEKLLKRQTIRKRFSGSVSMDLGEDNETI